MAERPRFILGARTFNYCKIYIAPGETASSLSQGLKQCPNASKNHTRSTTHVPSERPGWVQRALQSNAAAPRKK